MLIYLPSHAAQKDPTRPYEYEEKEKVSKKEEEDKKPPVLSGVYMSSKLHFAFIKDRFYKVGEQYGEMRVIAVEPNGVRLRGSGGEFLVLPLYEAVKAPVKKELLVQPIAPTPESDATRMQPITGIPEKPSELPKEQKPVLQKDGAAKE